MIANCVFANCVFLIRNAKIIHFWPLCNRGLQAIYGIWLSMLNKGRGTLTIRGKRVVSVNLLRTNA